VVERLIILSGEEITDEDVFKYVMPNSGKKNLKFKEIFEQFKNEEELQEYIKEEYTNFNKSN